MHLDQVASDERSGRVENVRGIIAAASPRGARGRLLRGEALRESLLLGEVRERELRV